MGGCQMTYSEFVGDLARQVDLLPSRSKAAVFWLLGSGLLIALEPPDEWATWFASAREVGYRFVTAGELSSESNSLWAAVSAPTNAESSQLFNSAMICLSAPLGIAVDSNLLVGAWVEQAFFPLLQHVSLELFDDVACPSEDEELDDIFATARFQSAVEFAYGVVAQMTQSPPDADRVDALVRDAGVIAPP